jgi:hypothetical protein
VSRAGVTVARASDIERRDAGASHGHFRSAKSRACSSQARLAGSSPEDDQSGKAGPVEDESDEEIQALMAITPEEWAESRRRVEEAERERTRRIFGDQPPTIYVDRYSDMDE